MNKEVMEFSAKQAEFTVCNGGKKVLVLLNERKEVRQSEGMEGDNPAQVELYFYDGYWLDIESSTVLEAAKQQKLSEIEAYDQSSKVNGFKLNGQTVWLDKATRVGLMNSTNIAKAMGSETTDLWLGDNHLTVNCDKAIQLLSALEMYALECFNVTAAHKKAVGELTNIEKVLEYDCTSGYPQQLKMTV